MQTKATRMEYERLRSGRADRKMYDWQWACYSKARLLENPLCVMCLAQGKEVLATCTDHIKPARKYPELFWEQSNHQSLCRKCNAKKCAKESQ